MSSRRVSLKFPNATQTGIMAIKVAWASIYLQFSSFNFLCSGLFGDILCLRFFLSWAYIWLLVNAITGFPDLGELIRNKPDEVFLLHIDTLVWTVLTLYVHLSKFTGIVLNERKVHDISEKGIPLWRMLYRNSGLSQLLFHQFVYPSKFEFLHLKAGSRIPTDDCLYIILDGVANTSIKLQTSNLKNGKLETQQVLSLTSGEIINIKLLHLFRQGAECEAFANQTVDAVCITDVTLYKITSPNIRAMAMQPQTKQAYQGLLIFALTNVAERAILDAHQMTRAYEHKLGPDGRDPAFGLLEEWEEPKPIYSGSGNALTVPLQHFLASLKASYRPPWPIIRWIPGLRHAALPAPHLLPGSIHGTKPKLYGSTTASLSSSSTNHVVGGNEETGDEESNIDESQPLL